MWGGLRAYEQPRQLDDSAGIICRQRDERRGVELACQLNISGPQLGAVISGSDFHYGLLLRRRAALLDKYLSKAAELAPLYAGEGDDMNRDIEFLEEIWIRMLDAGMIKSKGQFSTQMLGKGPSYLTSMAARDRNVPFEVFDHLADEIKRASEGEAKQIEETEYELLALLRGQKVRELLLSSIIDHQCEKSDEALDAIIEGNANDTFLSKFLKHAGLSRLA